MSFYRDKTLEYKKHMEHINAGFAELRAELRSLEDNRKALLDMHDAATTSLYSKEKDHDERRKITLEIENLADQIKSETKKIQLLGDRINEQKKKGDAAFQDAVNPMMDHYTDVIKAAEIKSAEIEKQNREERERSRSKLEREIRGSRSRSKPTTDASQPKKGYFSWIQNIRFPRFSRRSTSTPTKRREAASDRPEHRGSPVRPKWNSLLSRLGRLFTFRGWRNRGGNRGGTRGRRRAKTRRRR